eukprot:CAMPEP_0115447660 /NCGR_PEP_ID=MMETSP0271-20121206/40083_1 /TAXON_ID=71861 /ORGANISM="Scrippsiella trochoidea, Strain CCMP3099" /LENGTH=90 /DNA_ID=CAMNT_0002873743 /DNA_START=52 /DNA_END=320 /DNA_ORIENTATION=+
MSSQGLPNADSRTHSLSIDGRLLIVKNTFFELGESPTESKVGSSSRSRSEPASLVEDWRCKHRPQQQQQRRQQKQRHQRRPRDLFALGLG